MEINKKIVENFLMQNINQKHEIDQYEIGHEFCFASGSERLFTASGKDITADIIDVDLESFGTHLDREGDVILISGVAHAEYIIIGMCADGEFGDPLRAEDYGEVDVGFCINPNWLDFDCSELDVHLIGGESER